MLTGNTSFPPDPGTGNSFGWEAQVLFGSTPSASARARMNGLIAEPGWRCPLVARLNGRALKSGPPTIALTSPVSLSIATSEALGPMPARRPAIAFSAADWSSGSIVVLISQAAAEDLRRRVAVEQLAGDPAREVGLVGLDVRRVDLVLVGQRLAHRVLVLGLGDHLLVAHARQHQVAPLTRGNRVLERVVHRGRGDHPGEQRRLRRRQHARLARVRDPPPRRWRWAAARA